MPLPPPTYQALGPVYLLRWNQSAGHSVVRLTPADVAAELAVDVEYLGRNPMQLMKVGSVVWGQGRVIEGRGTGGLAVSNMVLASPNQQLSIS